MLADNVNRCTKCILPETFPGIAFDDNGVCNYCNDFLSKKSILEKEEVKKQMEEEIKRNKGKGDYDCIVAYSGGKDSSFTLMHLVRNYKLNCLAVTIDNDFMSDRAKENCYEVTKSLGVDFLLFKPSPSFMMGMYKSAILTGGVQSNSSIKRASSICNSCIGIVNNYVLKVAMMHNTGLIAGGYVGGQVPNDSSTIKISIAQREKIKRSLQDKYDNLYGKEARKYFFIDKALIENGAKNIDITIINPLLAMSISEKDIISVIEELGWKKTTDTGMNSSNCRLNDLGIAVHYKKHRFHPYEFEVADQVRHGLITRDKALEKVVNIADLTNLDKQIKKIGLKANEL